MVHGAISGVGKGPLVIFDKGCRVTSWVYIEQVIPGLNAFHRWMEAHPNIGFIRSILMEDNASIHSARITRATHQYYFRILMKWPANSPDLNPIENVWRLLKYRVGKRFPKTDEEVRQYVREEWDKLELQDFHKYIASMPERCKAVIAVNGGHTKW